MNRNKRIAAGLLIPSLTASLILALTYPAVSDMKAIDPRAVLVMLAFIVTSVMSAAFTAYFFKGLTFKPKQDIWFVYLNTYPWLVFLILYFDRFWILTIPFLITPLLGYWFGKRYFSL